MVGCAVAVADLHGDGGCGVGHVSCDERCRKPMEGCGSLVRNGRYGPALPVECAVPQMWDLRRQTRIDMEDVFGREAQPEVAEEGDLIGTAVAGQEGEGRVGAAVGGEVVGELFGELKPGGADVGVLGVLLVCVGCAAPGCDGGGDD